MAWFEIFNGSGKFSPLAAKLNRNFARIERALSEYGVTMTTYGPHRRRVLRSGGGSGAWDGAAYDDQMKLTENLNTDSAKPWVKYDRVTRVFSEQLGPPAWPVGQNEVWVRKADLSGRWYIR